MTQFVYSKQFNYEFKNYFIKEKLKQLFFLFINISLSSKFR